MTDEDKDKDEHPAPPTPADERFVDRDEDLDASWVDSDYGDDFPGDPQDTATDTVPDPGYAAFAEELEDPLANWPSPETPMGKLPETRTQHGAAEELTAADEEPPEWVNDAPDIVGADAHSEAADELQALMEDPATDSELFVDNDEIEDDRFAPLNDQDLAPSPAVPPAAPSDDPGDTSVPFDPPDPPDPPEPPEPFGFLQPPAAPSEENHMLNNDFSERSQSTDLEDFASLAPPSAQDDDFVDDFLNDLDPPESEPEPEPGTETNYESMIRQESISSSVEAAGIRIAAGLAGASDEPEGLSSSSSQDDPTPEHARDTSAGRVATDADLDPGRRFPIAMIAVVLLALLLLGVGGYGVMQQRNEMQNEIRDLQAKLATTVTPEQDKVERERQREVELENESLNAEMEGLAAENRELGDRLRAMEQTVATRESEVAAAAAAAKVKAAQEEAARSSQTRAARVAAAAATPAPSSGSAGWFVNFGSYAQRNVADRWAAELTIDAGRVEVQTATAAGKTLYRVRVVELADQDAAERVATNLERRYQLPRLWVGKN